MNRLRVGIIGAGYVSAHHLRALKGVPVAEVVGIADLNVQQANIVARKFGIPTAYEQAGDLLSAGVDVVHVLTPPASHAALAIQALESGANVLVEKPMAETPEDCGRMIAAAKASGRVLALVHSGRMDPAILRGVEMIRAGKIGKVLSLDFHRSSDYPAWAGGDSLPPHYRKGSYPFQDIGIHGMAIAEAFLGKVLLARPHYRSTHANPNLLFDEWTAEVECEHGQARMYLSWNVRPVRSLVFVHGTRGVLEIDSFLQTCRLTKVLPGPKFGSLVASTLGNSVFNLYEIPRNVIRFMTGALPGAPGIQNNVRAFYEALGSGRSAPVMPEEGQRLIQAMASACAQADKERTALRQIQLEHRGIVDVLVTGAGGFVGSTLIKRLVKEGIRVRAGVRRIPADAIPGVEYAAGDLGDAEFVDSLVAGAKLVIHAGAAMKGGRIDFQRGTVMGTRHVIESCLRHGVMRLVHVSSLSVMDHAGKHPGPVTESWPLEPHADRRGAYTQTKLEAEQLVTSAIRERNLPAVVVRPGVIFGPGAEPSSPAGSIGILGRWIVVGTGALPLPLIYVEDLVDALLLAATKSGIDGLLLNLVDSARITQREFIEAAKCAKPDIAAVYVPKALMMPVAAAIEALGRILKRDVPLSRYRIRSLRPLSNFDISAAHNLLGWSPRVGAAEGLRKTFSAAETAPDQEAAVLDQPVGR